jgi:hypothetical protein
VIRWATPTRIRPERAPQQSHHYCVDHAAIAERVWVQLRMEKLGHLVGSSIELSERHTELVRRERPNRRCEICRQQPATITVSSWLTGAAGSQRARSHYFCSQHAEEAAVLLSLLQTPDPDA